MKSPSSVLVLCTGNSSRSQIAEGLLRSEGGGAYDVVSAGTAPTLVRPEAIEVMKEIGIDISHHRSKSVEEFDGRTFDIVITVCSKAQEECPSYVTARERMAWDFDDPAAVEGSEEKRLDAYRRTREEILKRIRYFLLTDRD